MNKSLSKLFKKLFQSQSKRKRNELSAINFICQQRVAKKDNISGESNKLIVNDWGGINH